MFRKVLLLLMLFTMIPCLAEEESLLYSENINMTPQRSFSGYNSTGTTYPRLNNVHNSNIYRTYSNKSQQRAEIMKARSVRDVSSYSGNTDKPMSFNQFPQNRDSSDMLHMQQIQNGVQNMFMNF